MNRRIVMVASLLAIMLGACGGSGDGAAGDAGGGGQTIEVVLTEAGCEPVDITTPAGPTTFHVTNEDASAINEFEVLDGDEIVVEVEHVTPGLEGEASADLQPGTFETLCPGGTTAERGTLTVTE